VSHAPEASNSDAGRGVGAASRLRHAAPVLLALALVAIAWRVGGGARWTMASLACLSMAWWLSASYVRHRRRRVALRAASTNVDVDIDSYERLRGDVQALRAPVESMLSMTEALMALRLGAEQRDCVQVLRASATSTLLQIEAMAGGAYGASRRANANGDYDLHALLRGIERQLSAAASHAGSRLTLTLGPRVPTMVLGDSLGMRQLAILLVHESLRRASAEAVVLEASVSQDVTAEPDRYELRLSVVAMSQVASVASKRALAIVRQQDEGARGAGEDGGQGIAVARAVAENLGGRLYSEVDPGGALRIWADVPIRTAVYAIDTIAPVSDGKVIAFDDPFVRHRARVRSMRILVADDERASQLVLRANLQRAGHAVTFAADGEQALDLLVREQFDVVMIDMHMPGVSGIDVLKEARFLEVGLRRTPFVALSGTSSVEVVRELERLGVAALLMKPVVASELLDVLSRIRALADAPERDRAHKNLLLPPVPDAVIDAEVLRELANLHSSSGFLEQFTEQCVRDAARCLTDIDRAGRQGAWEAMREALQALRGVAGNLGARQLSEQCAELASRPTTVLHREWRAHHRHLSQLMDTVRHLMPVVLARLDTRHAPGGDTQSP
jgi:two-component system sensor histidine kinase RpfC